MTCPSGPISFEWSALPSSVTSNLRKLVGSLTENSSSFDRFSLVVMNLSFDAAGDFFGFVGRSAASVCACLSDSGNGEVAGDGSGDVRPCAPGDTEGGLRDAEKMCSGGEVDPDFSSRVAGVLFVIAVLGDTEKSSFVTRGISLSRSTDVESDPDRV